MQLINTSKILLILNKNKKYNNKLNCSSISMTIYHYIIHILQRFKCFKLFSFMNGISHDLLINSERYLSLI
jgi:hypothetical protein